jgi:hypothetical protein
MKDQFITILEALRLAKAELMTHEVRGAKNAPRTIERLKQILFDDGVTRALAVLGQSVDDGPSVVLPQDNDRQHERV